MANFKRRHRRGRHACWLCNPEKDCRVPAYWRYSSSELRRLGGRVRRIRRKDTDWAFRDDG